MLRIQILGGFHVTLDGEPVTGFISSKAQALLCYVAVNHARPHQRNSLATMFWGEMPDEDAATNLRQVIANLKRLLEPYLDITRQSIEFNTRMPYWLDVEAFEIQQDISLYHGELLAGFGLSDAIPFEDWLITQRERLHNQALSILRKQANTHLANGAEDSAIGCLSQLLALDALQEDAHRQLMKAFAMNGQRNAALAQYEKCRGILRDELGVEPETETTRLYDRLKTAKKMIVIPPENTPFIGREDELAEITRRLMDPICHLVTIVGLGGIGKTRLALHLAYQQVNRMLHGVVMVNLSAVTLYPSFLSSLADALSLTLSSEISPEQQILDFLREKQILLVLDNFEQIVDIAGKLVRDLLDNAPDLKILITSRTRVNLRGEWTLILQGLPVEYAANLSNAALTLFWETARRVRGDDQMTGQSAEAVQRICHLVEGMPLAIELAAAWTRLLTCEELAEELASNLTSLEASTTAGEERHRSLRAVFEHSWQLFSTHERQTLMALSVFVAGFTRQAAESVAGASLPLLLSLADKMLVRREANNRFSLHEMTRQYLVEKRIQAGESENIQTSFIRYYIDFLNAYGKDLTSASQQSALHEIWQDIDNVHAAWEIAIGGKNIPAIREMMNILSFVHDFKATWIIGESRFRQLINGIAPWRPDAFYAECLSHLAFFNSRLERGSETEEYANQSLSLSDSQNPDHFATLSRCLLALGFIQSTQGKFERAIDLYHQALDLRTRSGDTWGQANCYLNLASAYGRAKQFNETKYFAEMGLNISQRLGDILLTTKFQTNLAICASEAGDLEQAEKLHQSNYDIFEKIGSLEGQALALNGLGVVAYYRRDFARAHELFVSVLEMNRQLGAQTWEAGTLSNIGEIARENGDLGEALHYFRESQNVFRRIGHKNHAATLQQEIEAIEQVLKSGQ